MCINVVSMKYINNNLHDLQKSKTSRITSSVIPIVLVKSLCKTVAHHGEKCSPSTVNFLCEIFL